MNNQNVYGKIIEFARTPMWTHLNIAHDAEEDVWRSVWHPVFDHCMRMNNSVEDAIDNVLKKEF